MNISTKITEMLGIDKPFIGAPMFLVSMPDLVVAVSEAGGLGTFPTLNFRSAEQLREALSEIRERTKKPIGVNIVLYKEHNPNWAKQLEVCLDFKVELIITSLGTPKSIVKEARSIGTKVFCDATTLRHAKILERAGADAIVAVSQGAGGHAGNISPFSFLPYLTSELNIPVIAAGAISTGKQMAASFSLGAEAVYVGTRLIATKEGSASSEYKQMLIDSKPEEIIYTDEISGLPANWLKRSIDRAEKPKSHQLSADVSDDEMKRWRDIWSAGHGVAQINSIMSVEDVINEMITEYQSIKSNLP